MSTNPEQQIPDLPEQGEVSTDEQQRVKGGFNPQPDPPAELVLTSRSNPVSLPAVQQPSTKLSY